MTVQTQEVQKREALLAGNGERLQVWKKFSPRADVYETPEALVVVAEMPGVEENSLDITLEKNILTIRGHGRTGSREGYKLIYNEYAEGDYERSFVLSDRIDHDQIEAVLKNGVLRLVLSKAKGALARKIPVKVG